MPLMVRGGHAPYRLPLSNYWWLLLGRHSLRHVHSYLRLHKGLRIPLPWPEQECLHLHPKPYKCLLRYPCITRQPHLLQGWPTKSSLWFDPKPYHPSADSKLLPLGLITLSACSTRVSQPTHWSGYDATDLSLSWLTGSSPWLVLLQGQGGSLFCHDVLQGRLYVLSHSVSLFLKTGLRHCEAIYRAPLWRDRPLPSLWTCRDPDKAFLPTLLARSARRGLAAFYALWRLHLGSRSELSHPVLEWERTELVLTDWRRGRPSTHLPSDSRSQRTTSSGATDTRDAATEEAARGKKEAEGGGPSVAEHFARCRPLLDELCGEGGWLPFAFLSTSPHVWLILTEGGPVLAIDVNDTSVWRIADDLELLRHLGSLLLLSGLRLPLRPPSGSGEAVGEPGYEEEERRGRASTASATAATSTRGPTRPTRVTRKGRVATEGVHLPARPESEEQIDGHHGRQESSDDHQRGGSGRGHRDDGAHRHANDKTEPQQRGEHEERKQTDSGRHEHAQESQVARRDEEGTEQGGSGRSCGGATQTYGGRGRHDSCPSIPLSVPGPDPRLWVPPPHLLFPSPLPPMTPVDDEPSVRPRCQPSPAEEPPTCRPRPPRPSSDTPLSAVSRPSAPPVPPPSTARVRFFLSSSSPSYSPSPLSPPSPVSPSSPRSPFIPPIRSPELLAKPRVSSDHPAAFPPALSSAPARFETVPSVPSSASPSAPCVGKSQPPAAHTA
uniref:Protein DR1 n=1 Tax=Human betaherpesvirus 6A TaxID=32603 RepID=A0A219XZA0_9BETA|nr:protein DR1 [Human betaherpesvirus 6A]APO39069.1 protein DR1 [Human betaherpesvirus 6A]QOI14845.1 protein DR1 [Human betaherpesvirus 6A]QOI15017.1 protein DR1 [Human betaherpesvirus 6A]QOI15101.1 protein DR1 [Human betaherpesvirus 6A]